MRTDSPQAKRSQPREIIIRALNIYGEPEWTTNTRSWVKAYQELWGAGIDRNCPSLSIRKYTHTAYINHGGSTCICGGAAK